MGLDLSLVKVEKDDKGYVRKNELLDHDFCLSSTINKKYLLEVEHETINDDPHMPACFYNRPVDFDKAIEWVKANIDEYNSQIAIETLSLMKENEDYYLLEN